MFALSFAYSLRFVLFNLLCLFSGCLLVSLVDFGLVFSLVICFVFVCLDLVSCVFCCLGVFMLVIHLFVVCCFVDRCVCCWF